MKKRVAVRDSFATSWHMFSAGVVLALWCCGCNAIRTNPLPDRIAPSNDRPWIPELAVLPHAVIDGEVVHLNNIRNINYISDANYVAKYYDRTIRLDDVQTVDFVVTPFRRAPALAHTMLSFGLRDGTYLGLSVEIRNEVGEKYSPLLGISRQFEIVYVLADERDLIRVRTRHREADVYVYPSVATPEQAQRLFVDVLERVNKLSVEPEFYNTIANNCTTNLIEHVNNLNPDRIRYGWRVLLPGFSARYAYDLGLLDNRIPFEDLKLIAHINDLAETYYDAPDFSQRIRSRQNYIPRLAKRVQEQQVRQD